MSYFFLLCSALCPQRSLSFLFDGQKLGEKIEHFKRGTSSYERKNNIVHGKVIANLDS